MKKVILKKICIFLFFLNPYLGYCQDINMDLDEQEVEKNGHKGRYSVWYGCNHNAIIKPLIIVEGIDLTPVIIGYGGNHPKGIFDDLDKAGFLLSLISEGYDIVILDFFDGKQQIEDNADVLDKLITEVNTQLQTNNSPHQLVIMGLSMGGLVARYTLAKREHNGIGHNTKTLITFDTPHKGANVPLGLQHMIDFWRTSLSFTLPFSKLISIVDDFIRDKIISTNLNIFAPAAKQMALYYFQSNNIRANFITDLTNVGNYPKNLRKVAVANGSGIGSNQGFSAGDPIFLWHNNYVIAEVKNNVYSLPGKSSNNHIFEGLIRDGVAVLNFMNKDGSGLDPVDNAPGGYQGTEVLASLAQAISFHPLLSATVEIPVFCFIPVISALDLTTNDYFTHVHNISDYPYVLNSNITPFDAIFAPDNNTEHIRVPGTFDSKTGHTISTFFKSEISPDNLFIQNQNIGGTKMFEARNTITAGKNVTNMFPEGDVVVSGSNVIFRAGKEITLEDGFETSPGTGFETVIEPFPCAPPTCKQNNNSTAQNNVTSSEPQNIEKQPVLIKETDKNDFNILSAYPNPVNEALILQYSTGLPKNVSIILYNIFGSEVEKIIDNKHLEEGTHLVYYNTSNLIPGTYFYTIKADNYIQTQKMIKISQ